MVPASYTGDDRMDQGKAQRVSTLPALNPARQHTPVEASDEDPLSWPAPSYKSSQTQPVPDDGKAATALSTPSKQRLAVVLAASPKSTNDAYKQPQDGDTLGQVATDISEIKDQKMTAGSADQSQLGTQIAPRVGGPLAAAGSGRGRPKGWRPGMSYASMRGNSPRQVDSATAAATRAARTAKPRPHSHPHTSGDGKRRRGRPAKVSGTPPREVYRKLSPSLIAFLCEWAGCKAELHNLDTLRRHVFAIHGRSGEMQCRWGRCGSEPQQPQRFLDRLEFTAHVEEAHLVPVSWHVGDGPQNSLGPGSKHDTAAETDIPGFLKDARGNQVTPWVRYQEVEDQVTWKNNRRKLKELLIRRDENLPDEDSSSAEDENKK